MKTIYLMLILLVSISCNTATVNSSITTNTTLTSLTTLTTLVTTTVTTRTSTTQTTKTSLSTVTTRTSTTQTSQTSTTTIHPHSYDYAFIRFDAKRDSDSTYETFTIFQPDYDLNSFSWTTIGNSWRAGSCDYPGTYQHICAGIVLPYISTGNLGPGSTWYGSNPPTGYAVYVTISVGKWYPDTYAYSSSVTPGDVTIHILENPSGSGGFIRGTFEGRFYFFTGVSYDYVDVINGYFYIEK